MRLWAAPSGEHHDLPARSVLFTRDRPVIDEDMIGTIVAQHLLAVGAPRRRRDRGAVRLGDRRRRKSDRSRPASDQQCVRMSRPTRMNVDTPSWL